MESGPPAQATRISGAVARSLAAFGASPAAGSGRIGARAARASVRAWATVGPRGPKLWRAEGGIAVLVRGARAQPSVRAGAILQWWAAFRRTPTRGLDPPV